MRKASNWLWLAAFIALWCALRVFWIDADAGVPSLWEYGYNVTDEGYYMGAAKDKFLRGVFCDYAIGESFTYGYSPLTHWLAYVGYALFGLSSWGWRVPFLALYLTAWCLAFLYARRKCGNVLAFLWCAVFSSLPVVVAYERTACNDVAIAALAIIAFCLAAGKGWWRIPVAAAVAGAICLVKPSIWVLLPLVAAGILSERKTRAGWIDIGLFVLASAVAIAVWRGLAVLSLKPEAPLHGLTAAELIQKTTTHNALPSLLDFNLLFRGFSSFPRDICLKSLGPAAPLMTLVPLAIALRDIVSRRWSWRLLLYLSIPAYVAGVSTNNSICLHYYHPALLSLPILFTTMDGDFEGAEAKARNRTQAATLLFAASAAGLALLAALATPLAREAAAETFSTISNLPRRIVWTANWTPCVLFAVALSVVLAFSRGLRAARIQAPVWLALGFCAASVAFTGIPGFKLSFFLKQPEAEWLAPMAVSAIASALFLAIAFGLPATLFRRRAFLCFVPAAVLLALVAVPSWRTGAVELLTTKSCVQREAAEEIAALIPEEAVVIGERSRQILMAKPQRTATTMPGCDPIPIVRKVFAADPEAKVFALADSQNAYNLQHFREHAREYRLDLVREFKLPSFANGQPASVYLCRVVQLPAAATKRGPPPSAQK